MFIVKHTFSHLYFLWKYRLTPHNPNSSLYSSNYQYLIAALIIGRYYTLLHRMACWYDEKQNIPHFRNSSNIHSEKS